MNLSIRLSKVKDTVNPCDTVCDIGCDHGFVSIALIKEGRAKHVIACDINKGPLMAAKNNIASEGLSDEIETRLSDGLHKVNISDKPDALVIAGMGGALMAKILTEGETVAKNCKQLVLQPQSELFLVRKWIRENGFHIEKEQMLEDMGKTYFIIDARIGEVQPESEDTERIYDLFSGYLIKQKDPMLKEYLVKALRTNEGYLEGIKEDRKGTLNDKISDLKKAISLME